MFLDFLQAIQGKLISAVLVTSVNLSLTLSCKQVEVFFAMICAVLLQNEFAKYREVGKFAIFDAQMLQNFQLQGLCPCPRPWALPIDPLGTPPSDSRYRLALPRSLCASLPTTGAPPALSSSSNMAPAPALALPRDELTTR